MAEGGLGRWNYWLIVVALDSRLHLQLAVSLLVVRNTSVSQGGALQ